MKTTVFSRTVLLFLSLGLCRVHAALEWDKKEISVEVQRGTQETVNAQFDFKNTGKKTVTILEISTTCGCTVANSDSSTVRAGEKSNIHAIFTVGNRTGLQEKKITVMTDESETPVELILTINIVEPPSAPATAAGAGAGKPAEAK